MEFTESGVIVAPVIPDSTAFHPGYAGYVKNPKTGSIMMDVSSMVITLNKSGQRKSIRYITDYWASEIWEIDKAIHRIVNSDKWLYPAPDPWESGCIIEDRQ
jgi:hypothetical protein